MPSGVPLTEIQIESYKRFFLQALEDMNGLHDLVPERLKQVYPDIDIKWSYHCDKWRKKDPLFKAEYFGIKKRVIKSVENILMDNMLVDKDINTIKWFLARRDKDYIEKSEQEVTTNQPVQLNIIAPTDMKPIDAVPVKDKKELGDATD